MELDEIIDHHVSAIGGYAAVEGLHGLQVDFHLTEPAFEADGCYTAERKNRMRVDIFANNERIFSEGYDGSSGWQYPQGAKNCLPTSTAGTKALLHGIDNQLFGLHELKFRGYHLELLGQELVENTVFYVISVKHRDGHLVKRYINAANWRIERSRERKALHPDLDETEVVIETLASDFRNVNGLLRSFHERQVNLSTSETLQTTIVREIKINPSFHRDHFECPRPIKRKA